MNTEKLHIQSFRYAKKVHFHNEKMDEYCAKIYHLYEKYLPKDEYDNDMMGVQLVPGDGICFYFEETLVPFKFLHAKLELNGFTKLNKHDLLTLAI